MIQKGTGEKSESDKLTYKVMSVPAYGTKDTID